MRGFRYNEVEHWVDFTLNGKVVNGFGSTGPDNEPETASLRDDWLFDRIDEPMLDFRIAEITA